MGGLKEHGESSRLVIVAIHDRSQRDNICDFLRKAGLSVVAAASCQYALTACRAASTDPVLVAEIKLPDMWGLDLARAATQFHFKTSVICISEKELRRQCQEELNARGWRWLNSYSPDCLLQAIREVAEATPLRQKPSHALSSIIETESRNCG